MDKYDVIVIGAGPNGETAGAYLSKAGLKVLLLEKNLEAGGGLETAEVGTGGYLHNTHAIYMMMTEYAPPYQDLKLEEQYNLRHVYPSLQFAMPLSDGRCLCLWADVDKTCDSIAKFSEQDAKSYREVYHRFKGYVQDFLAPATYIPPLPILDQAVAMQQSEVGRELLEIAEKSPQQIVEELFTDEHVRAMMLYIACMWGLDYDVQGVGYLVPLYLNRATNYRLTVGGTHMLSQTLTKVIVENSGQILGSRRVERIIVEGGAAKGVQLVDGTIIEAAKAVISTVDTHQTFLKFVGEENLDKDFVASVKGWQWEKWSPFTVHLDLEEPPNFAAATSDPELNKALVYILGYETTDSLINHWEAIKRGELMEGAGFNCCFPTVHDPSQAIPERHTGLISQMAPYNLKEGKDKWYNYKFREQQAERCIATLAKYASNMTEDKILWTTNASPLDTENKLLDMVEGSFKQGAYHPLQMGFNRPNQECSNHRSPIKGLYMGGSCTYPGGCVLLGGGYLVANAVAEDLGIDKWWSEPEIVTEARKKGTL